MKGMLNPPRPLIAVSFGPKTMAEATAGLARVAVDADLVELRLDLLQEPYDLPALLRERPSLPLLVTLRPVDQGGQSQASAADRLAVLVRAAELGAEYVDLEWDAADAAAVAALKSAGARVVVSRHDFSSMPADLATGWWPDLAARGADVVKIVGLARDVRDCLPVVRALRQAGRPTIAIAMGEAGLPTRVLALREPSCFLTYANPSSGDPVAPGQLPIADMLTVYRSRDLGPETAAFGLLSPHEERAMAARYNSWFSDSGVDAVAAPFVAREDSADIVSAFRELPIAGWHIHGAGLQETVGQALDDLTPRACRQGKVNAIVARDSVLLGDWVESPEEQFIQWTSRMPPVATPT